jgi:hypothetical protein
MATSTFFIDGVQHDGGCNYASLVAGIRMRLAADSSAQPSTGGIDSTCD